MASFRSLPLLCLAGAALCAPAWAKNVLRNPGFESGDRQWQLHAAAGTDNQPQTITVVTTGARSGKSCLKMSANSFARLRINSAQIVPVAPGQTWRFSAWVRAAADAQPQPRTAGVVARITNLDRAAGDVHLYIDLAGQTASGVAQARAQFAPLEKLPSEWTRMTADVKIPAGFAKVRVEVMTFNAAGDVFWDDLSFEKLR